MIGQFQAETSKLTTRYILWGLPLVYFGIAVTFYLHTYDSAQVKITLAQMGITALMGLWLMEKIEDRHLGLTREYWPVYAPFFAFLVSGVCSFIFSAPYKWTNIDEFVRRLLYMCVAIMIFDRLKSLRATERALKFLMLALFVSCFYGFIQFLDNRFFPYGADILGPDIFVWRQAFAQRIFSTFGNPNFFGNYIVLMIPVVLSWAFFKKSFAGWCLLALALFNILLTETKGAWMGLSATLFIWVNLYALFIPTGFAQFIKARLPSIYAVVFAVFALLSMMTPYLNPLSVPFRIYTWLSTFEMTKAHPILGNGIGSFKVIYSAYRRPHIFHIEGKHNTESDHAENEHLEVIFDEGLIGFAIYIWLIFSVVYLSLRALNRWKNVQARSEPRAYYLIGILAGWLGMLVHNNFDVSMRFVSSGVYMGLLPALAVSLALSDRVWADLPMASSSTPVSSTSARKVLLYMAKIFALAAVAFVAVQVFREFYEIQARGLTQSHPGNSLMITIAWFFFIIFLGGGCYFYARCLISSKSVLACLIPLLLAYPMLYFWGWFRGDYHHNLGIVASKGRDWEQAIYHYKETIRRNKGFIMSYYFLGNVFNDRFDMTLQNKSQWGDPPGAARTDFDRAFSVYETIRRELAPNYVQMHFHVGNLLFKRGEWGKSQNESSGKVEDFMEESVRRYRLYQKIDPVFQENYYRLGFALTRLGRFREAQDEIKKVILAKPCAGHGHFGLYHHHMQPENFMNLANSYLLGGDYKRAVATYKDYAAHINPNQEDIRRNLNMLIFYKKNILEQLRQIAPAAKPSASYGIERSILGK